MTIVAVQASPATIALELATGRSHAVIDRERVDRLSVNAIGPGGVSRGRWHIRCSGRTIRPIARGHSTEVIMRRGFCGCLARLWEWFSGSPGRSAGQRGCRRGGAGCGRKRGRRGPSGVRAAVLRLPVLSPYYPYYPYYHPRYAPPYGRVYYPARPGYYYGGRAPYYYGRPAPYYRGRAPYYKGRTRSRREAIAVTLPSRARMLRLAAHPTRDGSGRRLRRQLVGDVDQAVAGAHVLFDEIEQRLRDGTGLAVCQSADGPIRRSAPPSPSCRATPSRGRRAPRRRECRTPRRR